MRMPLYARRLFLRFQEEYFPFVRGFFLQEIRACGHSQQNRDPDYLYDQHWAILYREQLFLLRVF